MVDGANNTGLVSFFLTPAHDLFLNPTVPFLCRMSAKRTSRPRASTSDARSPDPERQRSVLKRFRLIANLRSELGLKLKRERRRMSIKRILYTPTEAYSDV